MRISDWSSDVCSSDLDRLIGAAFEEQVGLDWHGSTSFHGWKTVPERHAHGHDEPAVPDSTSLIRPGGGGPPAPCAAECHGGGPGSPHRRMRASLARSRPRVSQVNSAAHVAGHKL